MRLARVFDDVEPGSRGNLGEGMHVGHLAVEVHGNDRARARRERRLRCGGIDTVVGVGNVGRYRYGAGLGDGLEGRDEGHGGDDDLVARRNARGEQAQPKGIEAARNADAMPAAAIGRKGALEVFDRGPVREGP